MSLYIKDFFAMRLGVRAPLATAEYIFVCLLQCVAVCVAVCVVVCAAACVAV